MTSNLCRLLFVTSLLLSVGIFVSGQIPFSGTPSENSRLGGLNVIAGTVHWPDGSRADRRINVKIRPQTSGDILLLTDESGQFIVINLPAGFYNVIIDSENGFEPVNQLVEIVTDGDRLKPVYTVSIRLVEKKKAESKAAVVKAESAGIPNRAKRFYARAMELGKAADHAGAITQLKLAIAEYPKFLEAHNELGVQYQKLNDLKNAELSLRAALAIKPHAFESMLNLGIVLFRTNRLTEAETSLREVVRIKDNSAIGHFYLGRSLAKLKNYDEAEKELNLAISLGGDEMHEAHRMLGIMYIDKDDRSKAAASLEKYLQLVPAAPDAEQLRQAIAQLKAGIPKE